MLKALTRMQSECRSSMPTHPLAPHLCLSCFLFPFLPPSPSTLSLSFSLSLPLAIFASLLASKPHKEDVSSECLQYLDRVSAQPEGARVDSLVLLHKAAKRRLTRNPHRSFLDGLVEVPRFEGQRDALNSKSPRHQSLRLLVRLFCDCGYDIHSALARPRNRMYTGIATRTLT